MLENTVSRDTEVNPVIINPSIPKTGNPIQEYKYPPIVGEKVRMTELLAIFRPSTVPVSLSETSLVIALFVMTFKIAPVATMGTMRARYSGSVSVKA